MFSLTLTGVWNLSVVWGIWKTDSLSYLTNVLFPVLVVVVWFCAGLIGKSYLARLNWGMESIVCLCRLSWSFLFGRVGMLFWTAIKEVTLCMIIGLVLEYLWSLSWSKRIRGSFWLLVWPDWEAIKCFLGFSGLCIFLIGLGCCCSYLV